MSTVGGSRLECVEELARSLPSRASLVARLVHRYAARYANFDLNPASTGILLGLLEQPRRITELAELEGQTQPYVTKLVSDLEARGWARRTRDPEDGRAVSVQITDSGRAVVSDVRRAVREMLSDRIGKLSDDQVKALAEASQALLLLIDALQQAVER